MVWCSAVRAALWAIIARGNVMKRCLVQSDSSRRTLARATVPNVAVDSINYNVAKACVMLVPEDTDAPLKSHRPPCAMKATTVFPGNLYAHHAPEVHTTSTKALRIAPSVPRDMNALQHQPVSFFSEHSYFLPCFYFAVIICQALLNARRGNMLWLAVPRALPVRRVITAQQL